MTEFESVITRGMTPISEERRERAVLVGVDRPGSTWPLASSLAELERLVVSDFSASLGDLNDLVG